MGSDTVFVGGSAWMAWTHAFGSAVKADGVGESINVEPAFDDPATQIPELTDDQVREKLLADYYVQCMLKQIKATKEIVGDEMPLMAGHDGPLTACGVLVGMEKLMVSLGMRETWIPRLIDFAVQCLAIYADLLAEVEKELLYGFKITRGTGHLCQRIKMFPHALGS
jgi:uroporphyrinogen-III decarboxylase